MLPPQTIRRFVLLLLMLAVLAGAGGCRTWWGLTPVPAQVVARLSVCAARG